MEEHNNDTQPRHPRNLQGLLRFAMEATQSEDAPNESNFAEMDPERRQFLEEALKSLTVNVVEQLEQAVKTIMSADSSEEESLAALEIISDYVQEIDAANDFFKVGGFCTINPCLSSPHPAVRSAALQLIRELAQNNPFCQEKLLAHGTLNRLVELLSDPADQVACDSMSAISAMVRAFEPGLNSFLDIGGLECMLGCLGDDARIKLQIRVAFLISTITSENPQLGDRFVQLNAVEKLAGQVEVPTKDEMEDFNRTTRLEKYLSALATLSGATEEGARRCGRAQLGLQSKLEGTLHAVKGREEFQEIVEYSREILNRIGSTQGNKEDSAER